MSTISIQNLLLAAGLAGGIAALAGILRLLSFSGVLAAFAVGFFVFGLGGLPFAVPLLAFFSSSSTLSLIGRSRKTALGIEAKSGRRDAIQVLANGGIPALLAIAYAVLPDTRQIALLFLAALAAANADTWATELGALSPWRPRLLSTFRGAPHGTSGAVSLVGTLAAMAGAAFIAWSGVLAWPSRSTNLLWKPDMPELITIAWAGFLAAYVDSLLGATVQQQFQCGVCGTTTDRNEHCGRAATRTRGLKWFTNDAVNLVASISGVLFAWLLMRFYTYPI